MTEKLTPQTLRELGISYLDSAYIGHSLPQTLHDYASSWEADLVELARLQALVEKQRAVVRAAQIILDGAHGGNRVFGQWQCPHGNGTAYPTHAWWCDDCFFQLENAIAVLDQLEAERNG